MSILEPITLSKPERIKIHLVEVSKRSAESLDFFIRTFEESLRAFWEHPEFTPQEIFDFYGTEAYKLFQQSDDTIAFIQKFKPDYVPAVNITAFTINKDGSVTVE